MANLTLTNVSAKSSGIKTKTDELRSELDARRSLFAKASDDTKKAWIEKDPIMAEAYGLYVFLKGVFGNG